MSYMHKFIVRCEICHDKFESFTRKSKSSRQFCDYCLRKRVNERNRRRKHENACRMSKQEQTAVLEPDVEILCGNKVA